MPNTEQSILGTNGIPEIEMEMEVNGMTQVPADKSLSIPDMAADAKAVGDRFADDEADLSNVIGDVAGIKQWTGADINVNTDDESPTIASAIADMQEDIEDLQGLTGEDIKLDDSQGAPTIKEAISACLGNAWPVGSLFITASNPLPAIISSIGTWVEVSVPLTWNDIKHGTRSYTEPETGFSPGNLRFWLRTA